MLKFVNIVVQVILDTAATVKRVVDPAVHLVAVEGADPVVVTRVLGEVDIVPHPVQEVVDPVADPVVAEVDPVVALAVDPQINYMLQNSTEALRYIVRRNTASQNDEIVYLNP